VQTGYRAAHRLMAARISGSARGSTNRTPTHIEAAETPRSVRAERVQLILRKLPRRGANVIRPHPALFIIGNPYGWQQMKVHNCSTAIV
jgi:hypothetical protein